MDDTTLHIVRPLWLYLAPLLLAVLWWLLRRADRLRERALALLVHPRFRARLMPGYSPGLTRWKRGLLMTALALLCVAAAGPQLGYEEREVKRRGIDLLFAVDTSRSMLAEDLLPNRLERARMGIQDFVDRLEGDRVGLIPFAGSAFALCPLTLDYDAFRESLKALDTDLIPRQGTDVASAIREAARLCEMEKGNHRILVLITDGEDLQGDALEAAKDAAKDGMIIYPVGVGDAEGSPIPLTLQNGRKDVLRDDSGAVVRTKLDEAALRKIAEVTGGIYAPLGRGAEGLDFIYQEKLRLVPKNEMDAKVEKIPLERYEWPLALALLLLLVEYLLPDRRRAPGEPPLISIARRKHLPTALLMALLALTWPDAATAAEDARVLYNSGTEEYENGNYARAAEQFRAALTTPDLKLQNRAYYNLGNALYRMGQASMESSREESLKSWEDALKAYSDALALDPADADARYNHDLVKRKLEQKDPDRKDQDKKDGDKKDSDKDKKDGDKKDGKDKQAGDKNDGEKQDGEKQDGESQDGKDGEKSGEKGDKSEGKSGQGEKDGKPSGEGKPGDEKDAEGTGKQSAEDKPGDGQKPDGSKPGEEKPGEDKKDGASAGGKEDGQKEGESGKEQADGGKGDKEGTKKEEPGKGEKESGDKDGEKSGKDGKAGKEGKENGKAGDKDKAGKEAAGTKESQENLPEGAGSETRRKVMQMSPEEARQLLQTLRGDERTVVPLERPQGRQRFRDPSNSTKGKTW